jgi:uroporphyrinogen-III synthase
MKRLIVLRPEPGATSTVEAAREAGLKASAFPLFEVKALPWQAPDATSFDGLLLTSANALFHGGEQLAGLRGLRAYCVGEATATAARDSGFDIAASGKADVDRLLGSIEPDLRLLHLAGKHHKSPTGAKQQLSMIPVYIAEELPCPDGLARVEGSVVAVHSPRAARRLAAIFGEKPADRSTISIAAISTSAADAAGVGWLEVRSAEAPNDTSLLALAAAMCNKPT